MPEVDVNGGGGGHERGEAVDRECAGIVDHKVRLAKGCQLGLGRPDEHVVHEERVVCSCTHDSHLDACLPGQHTMSRYAQQ